MPSQQTLKLPIPQSKDPSLHEVIIDVLRIYGPRKQSILALQLEATESHLSEVLKGDGSKHWPERWQKFIAKNYDPEGRIAACVASWSGLEVRAARKWSDAEYRRRSERVIHDQGGMGAAWRTMMEALPEDEVGSGDAP